MDLERELSPIRLHERKDVGADADGAQGDDHIRHEHVFIPRRNGPGRPEGKQVGGHDGHALEHDHEMLGDANPTAQIGTKTMSAPPRCPKKYRATEHIANNGEVKKKNCI